MYIKGCKVKLQDSKLQKFWWVLVHGNDSTIPFLSANIDNGEELIFLIERYLFALQNRGCDV